MDTPETAAKVPEKTSEAPTRAIEDILRGTLGEPSGNPTPALLEAYDAVLAYRKDIEKELALRMLAKARIAREALEGG